MTTCLSDLISVRIPSDCFWLLLSPSAVPFLPTPLPFPSPFQPFSFSNSLNSFHQFASQPTNFAFSHLFARRFGILFREENNEQMSLMFLKRGRIIAWERGSEQSKWGKLRIRTDILWHKRTKAQEIRTDKTWLVPHLAKLVNYSIAPQQITILTNSIRSQTFLETTTKRSEIKFGIEEEYL